MKRYSLFGMFAGLACCFALGTAHAEMVSVTVGTQVATDGDIMSFSGSPSMGWIALAGGQALADMSLDTNDGIAGSDSDSGDTYVGSWTFSYAAFTDPVLLATLSFGIIDHDSAAAGDQVDSFTVDGFDLTTELNAAFNAEGGGVGLGPFQSQYNVYSLNLTGAALLASLADGTAVVNLRLKNGYAGGPNTTLNNGAAVDFSTLVASTVPEPSSLVLFSLGLSGAVVFRGRKPVTRA